MKVENKVTNRVIVDGELVGWRVQLDTATMAGLVKLGIIKGVENDIAAGDNCIKAADGGKELKKYKAVKPV